MELILQDEWKVETVTTVTPSRCQTANTRALSCKNILATSHEGWLPSLAALKHSHLRQWIRSFRTVTPDKPSTVRFDVNFDS